MLCTGIQHAQCNRGVTQQLCDWEPDKATSCLGDWKKIRGGLVVQGLIWSQETWLSFQSSFRVLGFDQSLTALISYLLHVSGNDFSFWPKLRIIGSEDKDCHLYRISRSTGFCLS